ncbi:MAG TPA: 2-dehydropantoate 2-reductase N-terminal domain-containing protein, partial [Alphaproteobacteria bacterium]|nr:2-dehydropantoate 2-reductase N-terminal domain-containing protein [Alphaproteobacteria bacterium]
MAIAFQKIGIIGAGAWGTALAIALQAAGRDVKIWAREEAVVQFINTRHENAEFLHGVMLDPAIRAVDDFSALSDCQLILLCPPAQHMGTICKSLAGLAAKTAPLVICSKGIDAQSGALMHEIVAAAMPGRPFAALSGPTFASEVAKGLPAAIVVASPAEELAKAVAESVSGPYLRPYTATDIVG